jgi:hypothetical protein
LNSSSAGEEASNAANANYSSTLVAEAPAVKHFERLQRQLARKFGDGRYGGPGRCGALWRVLEHAVEWGNLPRAVLERVALHVEPPSPVARDKDKETARAAALNKAGVLSKATWSKWEGLDRNRERRQIKQEKQEDQPQGRRDRFTEAVGRILEASQPHKSDKFKGTEIGYDSDKHNANCRLTGPEKGGKEPSQKGGESSDQGKGPPTQQDKEDRAKQVAQFISKLTNQLQKDEAITSHVVSISELVRTLTPEQRDRLYQQSLDNGERWAAEAANQSALQQELAKDPDLARALEAEVARLRAEWDKATPDLSPRERRLAAPWLYAKDYKYFAPTLTPGPDGQPEFAFLPTPALRRLQLMQALLLDVDVRAYGADAPLITGRRTAFGAPGTDAEALAWYQLFGATQPDDLANIGRGGGGLGSANSDLQILVPTGALLGASRSLAGYLLRIAVGIGENAAIAAAAETVAEKYGPAAAAVVPFVPTLVGLLRRRIVTGAAFQRFTRRVTAPVRGKLFGLHEWEVAPGQQARVTKTIHELEAEYLADTGRRPVVVAADHPEGALGHINPKNGRIEIYSGERFGPAARAEELFHYQQLKARGLLGKSETEIGQKVIQEMEEEVERMLRNAGFQLRR